MRLFWIVPLTGLLLAGCATEPVGGVANEWGAHADDAHIAYGNAMAFLGKGRQVDAEALAADACDLYPDSQRLLFLCAVLQQSRNEKKQAIDSFTAAEELDSRTLLGRAAKRMIAIDNGKGGLDALAALADAHPDELLFQWLFAMEATALEKTPEKAAMCYERLLSVWKVAPITVHEGYAQLLTGALGHPEKALEHCQLAAELEPGTETYQALAYTLHRLKRYADADRVYGKLLEMEPSNFLYWIQWGNTLAYMGDFAAAAGKFEQAGACNPADVISLLCWGRCLEEQGDPAAGFKKYEEAVAKSPSNEQARTYVAHSKLYGYGATCDFEAALKAFAKPGMSAIDNLREQTWLIDDSDNPLAPRNSALLLKHLAELGEDGDAEAQYSLAMIYRHGIGVPKAQDASDRWLRRAAGNGHAIAQRMLNPPL